jgi:hypothetical protein
LVSKFIQGYFAALGFMVDFINDIFTLRKIIALDFSIQKNLDGLTTIFCYLKKWG